MTKIDATNRPFPTPQEAKILRLQKKVVLLREKSLGANAKVKELLQELHYANIILKSKEKHLDHYRVEASTYKQKYCALIKDIKASKEELNGI